MSTTIAITGADGFIGSHLAETLVGSGYRVRAMVQYNSFGSWGWLESLHPEALASIEVVPGDVRDRNSVLSLMTGRTWSATSPPSSPSRTRTRPPGPTSRPTLVAP